MEKRFKLQWGAKKDAAELQLLMLLEEGPFHGYEITKLIPLIGLPSLLRSAGPAQGGEFSQGNRTDRNVCTTDAERECQAASLYPMLYRLQKRGWIEGRWVELPGKQRRRYYRLTAAGRKVLAGQRQPWRALFRAVERLAQVSHA